MVHHLLVQYGNVHEHSTSRAWSALQILQGGKERNEVWQCHHEVVPRLCVSQGILEPIQAAPVFRSSVNWRWEECSLIRQARSRGPCYRVQWTLRKHKWIRHHHSSWDKAGWPLLKLQWPKAWTLLLSIPYPTQPLGIYDLKFIRNHTLAWQLQKQRPTLSCFWTDLCRPSALCELTKLNIHKPAISVAMIYFHLSKDISWKQSSAFFLNISFSTWKTHHKNLKTVMIL